MRIEREHRYLEDIDEIRDFMREDIPRKNNEITVLWSDRELEVFCVHNSSGCEPLVAAGLTSTTAYNRPLIMILGTRRFVQHYYGNQISETDMNNFVSIMLAHEITHTLGLSDDYYRDSHILLGEDHYYDSISCIMETALKPSTTLAFYEAVFTGYREPLCDECLAEWQSKMNSSFYKGNN